MDNSQKGPSFWKTQKLIFKDAGIRQGWWYSQKKIVLAVSGGSDSMALLWFFRSFWDGSFVVAHLEHGIRGESSRADARFVENICQKWKLPLYSDHLSVPDLCHKGESIEQAARRLRYNFLENVSKKCNAGYVAMAHTADDVVETVLYNLARGTGPAGLVGIPERRDFYVRPLIDFFREELRYILRDRSISWKEDETNDDVTIMRNRIRHELVPWMENYINKRSKEHIVSMANHMVYSRQVEELSGNSLLACARRNLPYGIFTLDLKFLRKLEKRSLHLLLRRMGQTSGMNVLPSKRMDKLSDLIYSSGRFRFQWEKDTELVAGQGLVSMISRENIGRETFNKLSWTITENQKDISTPFWNMKITLETVISDHQFERRGFSQALLFLVPGEELTIIPLSECTSKWAKQFLEIIPWWLHQRWPVVKQKGKFIWVPSPAEIEYGSDDSTLDGYEKSGYDKQGRLFRFFLDNKLMEDRTYE